MTEAEIIKDLDCYKSKVMDTVKELAETVPSIQKKFRNGKIANGSQFSLEEVKMIYKKIGVSELRLILLEENWKDKKEVDVYTIPGTHQFLEDFAKNPHKKCCNTCKYLGGKATDTIMPVPYCKVYEELVKKLGMRVYEDWCTSYSYIEFPKPRQWFKDNAPSNLDMFGNTNTVNGIDKSKFKSGDECKGDPVTLVNQVGFDE